MVTKRCKKCREIKPLDGFYKQSTGRLGRMARCKACQYTKVDNDKRKVLSADLLCNVCKERKPRTDFYGDPTKPTSSRRCKACDKKRNAARPHRPRSKEANARHHHARRGAKAASWNFRLAKRFSDVCQKCGSDGPLQYDHIKPVAHGGTSMFWNLQMLCSPCNNKKGATYARYSNYGNGGVYHVGVLDLSGKFHPAC